MRLENYQLGFSSAHPDAMYNAAARERKAGKTLAILRDHLGPLEHHDLLDIGCSTGFMTQAYAGQFHSVVGVDIDEPAVQFAISHNPAPNVRFVIADAMQTGLPATSFDVVTCTHIYEHVPDSGRLIEEIYRVLKPGGVCMFSADNRFKLIESHHRLPLLAALPKPIGHVYYRLAGKGDYYYENHLSYWGLRRLVRKFEIIDYSRRVIADPERFCASDMIVPGSFKQRLALLALSAAYWVCPTFIWLLKKPA